MATRKRKQERDSYYDNNIYQPNLCDNNYRPRYRSRPGTPDLDIVGQRSEVSTKGQSDQLGQKLREYLDGNHTSEQVTKSKPVNSKDKHSKQYLNEGQSSVVKRGERSNVRYPGMRDYFSDDESYQHYKAVSYSVNRPPPCEVTYSQSQYSDNLHTNTDISQNSDNSLQNNQNISQGNVNPIMYKSSPCAAAMDTQVVVGSGTYGYMDDDSLREYKQLTRIADRASCAFKNAPSMDTDLQYIGVDNQDNLNISYEEMNSQRKTGLSQPSDAAFGKMDYTPGFRQSNKAEFNNEDIIGSKYNSGEKKSHKTNIESCTPSSNSTPLACKPPIYNREVHNSPSDKSNGSVACTPVHVRAAAKLLLRGNKQNTAHNIQPDCRGVVNNSNIQQQHREINQQQTSSNKDIDYNNYNTNAKFKHQQQPNPMLASSLSTGSSNNSEERANVEDYNNKNSKERANQGVNDKLFQWENPGEVIDGAVNTADNGGNRNLSDGHSDKSHSYEHSDDRRKNFNEKSPIKSSYNNNDGGNNNTSNIGRRNQQLCLKSTSIGENDLENSDSKNENSVCDSVNDNGVVESNLSPNSEFQEGLKSILYWHLIGSYQNLHKLSDKECGDFLIGLRDQASLDHLDPKEGSIKLDKKGISPLSSPTGKLNKRPTSLAACTKIQPHLGLVTFCTCGLISSDQNKSPYDQSKDQTRSPFDQSKDQTRSPYDQNQKRSLNDQNVTTFSQVKGETRSSYDQSLTEQDIHAKGKRSPYSNDDYDNLKSPSKSEGGESPGDYKCDTLCSNCGKYLQNRYLTPSPSARQGYFQYGNSPDNRACSPGLLETLDNQVIAQSLISARPDILKNPQLRKLDTALDDLRRDSLDAESKLEKLLQLDSALDYLVDMVTEKVISPAEMTSISSLDTVNAMATINSPGQSGECAPVLPSSPPRDVRPKSFLHDEMDEFDRIFSELLFSPHKRMSQLASNYVKTDSGQVLGGGGQVLGGNGCSSGNGSGEVNRQSPSHHLCSSSSINNNSNNDGKSNVPSYSNNGAINSSRTNNKCDQLATQVRTSSPVTINNNNKSVATPTIEIQPLDSSPYKFSRMRQNKSSTTDKSKRSSLHEDMLQSYETESPSVQEARNRLYQSSLKKLKSSMWDGNDKLFSDLLDDLDNISELDTKSARKRQKARDMFSDWLFSQDAQSPENTLRIQQQQQQHQKDNRKTPSGAPKLRSQKSDPTIATKRRSVDLTDLDLRTGWFNNRWRPRSFEYQSEEDDTDSGYHTGDKTLAEQARRVTQGMVARQPGEFTITREDLRKNIEAFNFNNYGLIMSLQPESITFQGFIRVYMNLIRPINMSLSVRPPSIYEVLSHEDEETEGGVKDGSAQIASFYLPKDTTKVIHISSDTTTQEVIKALLSKYKITDNPRKFALYERVEEDGCQSVMRRCVEDEQPLPLCLSWGSQGLNTHKFVLQENDTGEIIWDAFSIPELENFLKILNREEEEYQEQIKAKYQLMNVHIIKKLEEMDKQRKKTTEKGKIKNKSKSGSQQKTNSKQSPLSASLSGSQSEKSRTDTDLHLDTGAENKSRTGKEKSPPADKFGEDEREPVFV